MCINFQKMFNGKNEFIKSVRYLQEDNLDY